MKEFFRKFSQRTAELLGTPGAFILAILLLVVWVLVGPLFHFSDSWQLVINTATTIITFLMVFVIQNTQNRDARALHLKLDELIRAIEGARNSMVDIEELSDEKLDRLQKQFRRISKHYDRASEHLDEAAMEIDQKNEEKKRTK